MVQINKCPLLMRPYIARNNVVNKKYVGYVRINEFNSSMGQLNMNNLDSFKCQAYLVLLRVDDEEDEHHQVLLVAAQVGAVLSS